MNLKSEEETELNDIEIFKIKQILLELVLKAYGIGEVKWETSDVYDGVVGSHA